MILGTEKKSSMNKKYRNNKCLNFKKIEKQNIKIEQK